MVKEGGGGGANNLLGYGDIYGDITDIVKIDTIDRWWWGIFLVNYIYYQN